MGMCLATWINVQGFSTQNRPVNLQNTILYIIRPIGHNIVCVYSNITIVYIVHSNQSSFFPDTSSRRP